MLIQIKDQPCPFLPHQFSTVSSTHLFTCCLHHSAKVKWPHLLFFSALLLQKMNLFANSTLPPKKRLSGKCIPACLYLPMTKTSIWSRMCVSTRRAAVAALLNEPLVESSTMWLCGAQEGSKQRATWSRTAVSGEGERGIVWPHRSHMGLPWSMS